MANLASLLATADDLPKSPKGWITAAILPTYAGKGVPGNFDTNTQEIVGNGVLSLRMEFTNLSPKTLLPRLWPLTIASIECALTLGILLLVDLNLLNSSFVSLPLSLSQLVVPASIRLLSLYSCTSAASQCTSLRCYLFLSCTGQTGHPPRW